MTGGEPWGAPAPVADEASPATESPLPSIVTRLLCKAEEPTARTDCRARATSAANDVASETRAPKKSSISCDKATLDLGIR